ncbi:MAG: hypothetical protein AMXMBFR47_22670 [Planctomycetota bacterium]
MTTKCGEAPIHEVRAGAISGAVWGKSTTLNGRPVVQHTIRIEKRYRDERSGEWKTTGYLRPDDLPKLALVASKLYEYLTLQSGKES